MAGKVVELMGVVVGVRATNQSQMGHAGRKEGKHMVGIIMPLFLPVSVPVHNAYACLRACLFQMFKLQCVNCPSHWVLIR